MNGQDGRGDAPNTNDYGPYGSGDGTDPTQSGGPSGTPSNGYGEGATAATGEPYGQPGQTSQPGQYGQSAPYGESSQYGQSTQYPQAPAYDPYAQGGYAPAHQPAPAGPAPKRTGPVLMIVLGFLTMILAPIIGVIAGASMLGGLAIDAVGNMTQVPAQGGTTTLEANSNYLMFDVSPTGEPDDLSTCEVTDPAGQPVSVMSAGGSSIDSSMGGLSFVSGDAGLYTISCGSSVQQVGIFPMPGDQQASEYGQQAVGAVTPLIIGAVVGFIGFVVGIIGIVWLVRVNKNRRALGY